VHFDFLSIYRNGIGTYEQPVEERVPWIFQFAGGKDPHHRRGNRKDFHSTAQGFFGKFKTSLFRFSKESRKLVCESVV
jgi:hypothetical protein